MRYDTYLNMMFREKPRTMFTVSAFRGGGDDHSGIFWADWQELKYEKEYLPINQIVGHTARYGGDLEIRDKKFIFNTDSILKNETFHEIYKNQNKDWIIKNYSI